MIELRKAASGMSGKADEMDLRCQQCDWMARLYAPSTSVNRYRSFAGNGIAIPIVQHWQIHLTPFSSALCGPIRYVMLECLQVLVFKRIGHLVRVARCAHFVVLGNLALVFLDKAS